MAKKFKLPKYPGWLDYLNASIFSSKKRRRWANRIAIGFMLFWVVFLVAIILIPSLGNIIQSTMRRLTGARLWPLRLLGESIIIFSFLLLLRIRTIQLNITSATGEVIKIILGSERDFMSKANMVDAYYYKIEYQTKEGEKFNFIDENGTRSPIYEIGKKVKVYYDPANPDQAQLNKPSEGKSIASVFFIVGVIIFAISFLVS